MPEIRYTLLAEGSSDRALLPIITWTLRCHLKDVAIQSSSADLSRLPLPPKGLVNRIKSSLDLYPCDVLFVHRDTDNQGMDQRIHEIETAIAELALGSAPPVIGVIPIRMMEAWLMFDEAIIRRVAGNPSGREPLSLPLLKQVESIADPKDRLNTALRVASGLQGRRLKKFRPSEELHRITDLTDDFSPLRQLSAFQRFEGEIQKFALDFLG
jgi:hypothetical protein